MSAIGIIFTFLFENKSYAIMKVDIIITYFYMLCHVLVCSFVILQRVVVLLCCGLSFGIAMPAYNRTCFKLFYVNKYFNNIKQCK